MAEAQLRTPEKNPPQGNAPGPRMVDRNDRGVQVRWLVGSLILLVVGVAALAPFGAALPAGLAALVATVLLALMMFAHASLMIGVRSASTMFGTGIVVAYAIEEFAIHFGIAGGYHFTDLMGPKIDVVPLAIPLGWVSVLYLGWVMANLIIDGAPTPRRTSHYRIIAGALAADLISTTIDLAGDPTSVHNGMWVWESGGYYFGVPVGNYVAWVVIGVATLIIHGYQERRHIDVSLDTAPRGPRIWSILPVVLFGLIAASNVVTNYLGVFGIVCFFAMGMPFVLALIKWIDWYRRDDAATN